MPPPGTRLRVGQAVPDDDVGRALDAARAVEANLGALADLMGPEKAARALEEAVSSLERKAARRAARLATER